MTELDKNGRTKIYCANCGKRMNYTYTQQWFGTNGIKTHHYYHLSSIGQVYNTRQEAEARLRELESTGHDYRGYDGNSNRPLQIDIMYNYGSPDRYYVEYSEVIGEAVPFQFHSQQCMMDFLQRADVIQQIMPIIDAHKAEPIVPAAKTRKKRVIKSATLPSYAELDAKLGGI